MKRITDEEYRRMFRVRDFHEQPDEPETQPSLQAEPQTIRIGLGLTWVDAVLVFLVFAAFVFMLLAKHGAFR